MKYILSCREVSKYFGDFAALYKVSFDVPEGTIFGIAGPNGAGKTTLFNVITGFYRPTEGKIIYEGEEIQGLKPHDLVQKGIARTFQIPVRFKGLTYLDTVKVGAIYGNYGRLSDNLLRYNREMVERIAVESMELVGLAGKESNSTLHASLLDLKLLMLASALSTKPKLLLLDEIVSGLTEQEMSHIWDVLLKINREYSITLIVIEHVMKFLMNISDIVMILNAGRVVCVGKPKEVARNEEVINSYLGEEYRKLVDMMGGTNARD